MFVEYSLRDFLETKTIYISNDLINYQTGRFKIVSSCYRWKVIRKIQLKFSFTETNCIDAIREAKSIKVNGKITE